MDLYGLHVMNNQTTRAEVTDLLKRFCQQEQLPAHYQKMAQRYFVPLADELATACAIKYTSQRNSPQHYSQTRKPLFIGINGSQGSGKSTLTALLSELLTHCHALRVANLSIDDFYHTQTTRNQLANTIHPLLKTRGVPGTHDAALLTQTLHNLSAQTQQQVLIPRFNKAVDDRHEPKAWDNITTPVDIVLLEGWCVGVKAQSNSQLLIPCNDLEKNQDANGRWRTYVNRAITDALQPIFNTFDQLIMLQAPSFGCVYEWRKMQEDKLRQRLTKDADQSGLMNEQALSDFIQHYQRLTEHMLVDMPAQANIVFTLNQQHEVTTRINNG